MPQEEKQNTITEVEIGSDTPEVQEVVAGEKDTEIQPGLEGKDPVTVVMKPPKKSKVAVIIVSVLLGLGLVGLAVWWFAFYDNPEAAVLGGVKNLLKADSLSTSTVMHSKNARSDATVTFDIAMADGAGKGSLSLDIDSLDAGGEVKKDGKIELSAGVIVPKDENVYVQVDKLSDTIDRMVGLSKVGAFGDVIEAIDGTWWQISTKDIDKTLAENGATESKDTQAVTDFVDCTKNITKDQRNKEFLKLYKQNKFLVVTKAEQKSDLPGNKAYDISLDYDKMAGFMNSSVESETTKGYVACFNELIDKTNGTKIDLSDINEVDADDLKDVFPEDLKLTVDVTVLGHKLSRTKFVVPTNGESVDITTSFAYGISEIKAPEEYKPISDLIEEIQKVVLQNTFGVSGLGSFSIGSDEDDDWDIDEDDYEDDDDLDIDVDLDFDDDED